MTTKVSSQARINVVDLVEAVREHPLYEHVSDENSLRILMRTHVFAVWDFQSLLKSLQRSLTCVDVPWLPTADAEARRFVNEIVLDEESDVAPGGGYLSQFELYVQAMTECGADREPIELGFKDAVFPLKVGDHLLLVPLQPASDHGDEDMENHSRSSGGRP